MSSVDRSRQKRPQSPGCRTGLVVTAAALLALAGCEGSYGLRQQGDPMVGIHAQPMPAVPIDGAAPVQTASAAVPPLPATHTAPNLSVMAGGTTMTPADPRDLRIDAPVAVPVSSPAGAARGVAPGNPVLEEPVPAPQSTSSRLTPITTQNAGLQQAAASSPGAAAVPPLGAMTFEEAQQYLKKRGVVWQRLETWGDQGQWKFRCSVPVPNKPINHTYETVSPLPTDPLMAVRAVLRQIEQEPR